MQATETTPEVKATRPKMPGEAIELYNLFIHGVISRRAFMDGVQRFAVGGLTAAAVIEALMPQLRAGAAGRRRTTTASRPPMKPFPRRKATEASRAIWSGPSAPTRAATTPSKLPGIIVVHENRGLNPHIEDIARRFALQNFMAFAPDGLTSLGGFPGDDYNGGQMFTQSRRQEDDRRFRGGGEVAEGACRLHRQDRRHRILLRRRRRQHAGGSAGCRISRPPRRSTARFRREDDVPKIKARDPGASWRARYAALAATWPAYDEALTAINVPHEGYIYPNAVHGFNCDATPERYNKAAADLAWDRTIGWFNKYGRAASA